MWLQIVKLSWSHLIENLIGGLDETENRFGRNRVWNLSMKIWLCLNAKFNTNTFFSQKYSTHLNWAQYLSLLCLHAEIILQQTLLLTTFSLPIRLSGVKNLYCWKDVWNYWNSKMFCQNICKLNILSSCVQTALWLTSFFIVHIYKHVSMFVHSCKKWEWKGVYCVEKSMNWNTRHPL